MKYSHASHKDRANIWQWSHKIVKDYKQKVCLQCWKKRLDPAMTDVEFIAALSGLNGRGVTGGSACWQLTLCPPVAGPRSWGGSERSLPTPSTLTHSHTQTHFTPFLFFSVFPPRPDQKTQVSLSLFFPPSLLFIISLLKLYIWVTFNLYFSPLTSTPVIYSPSDGTSLHSPSLPHQWAHLCAHTFSFRLYFYCNFSMFRSTNTLCYNCWVFRTITCCTVLQPGSNRTYITNHPGLLSDAWLYFCS